MDLPTSVADRRGEDALSDLIARLEKATGADRELDFSIAFQIQWRPQTDASRESFALHEAKHDYATAWIAHAPWRHEWPVPHFTASIDAALTLVPESFYWEVHQDGCAFVRIPNTDEDVDAWRAATPAIALCIAALKARLATPSPTPPSNGDELNNNKDIENHVALTAESKRESLSSTKQGK